MEVLRKAQKKIQKKKKNLPKTQNNVTECNKWINSELEDRSTKTSKTGGGGGGGGEEEEGNNPG